MADTLTPGAPSPKGDGRNFRNSLSATEWAVRHALGIVLLFAACQSPDKKTPPPTEGPASGSLMTAGSGSAGQKVAEVASVPSADRTVPPLPDPLPGKRTTLAAIGDKAWRVAIGDLDGDHKSEIVACDSQRMTVLDASGKKLGELEVVDGIQKLVVADLEGDGKAEIYAGWGQTREHMDTKAHLSVVRFDHGKLTEEQILQPATSRNESVSIVPMLDTKTIYFSYFDSKYMVSTVLLAHEGTSWTMKPALQIRMATSFARGDVDGDGKPDLVVGRVYGDDKGIDGDAFVQSMGADGKRTMIPSTRGLRSIAVIDGDVYMGDGWHQNYGTLGRGLLSRSRIVGGAFVTNTIEDTPGQYAIEAIIPATIEKKRVIVTMGSHYTRAFRPNGDKWEAVTLGGLARDIAVGDLDGKPGDEILILGDKTAEIVNLEGATWSPIP